MQKELTINISDEIYQGLMKLAGEKNASRFIESLLRSVVSESKEYKVEIPLNDGKRKVFIRSPRLAKSSGIEKLKMELVEENVNA